MKQSLKGFDAKTLRWMKAAVYGPPLALFLESIVSLLVDFRLPRPMIELLYPSHTVLERYCSTHSWLFDSITVESLYVLQLLTLVTCALLLLPIALSPKPPLKREAYTVWGLLILSAVADYWDPSFTFAPKWVPPNSVTESSLGMFRYACMFSLATLGMASFAFGGPRAEIARN